MGSILLAFLLGFLGGVVGILALAWLGEIQDRRHYR